MINLTLRQLRYFEALAQHGHFGQAAAACSVSQPALSVQIKDMEETLGAPLFERGTRQARLTGFGEALANMVGLHRVWDRAPAVMASKVAPAD